MELILATNSGTEEGYIDYDFDINVNEDFEIKVDDSAWDGSLGFGKRVYIPDTEYGGIIREIRSNTSDKSVSVLGFSWRARLYKKAITLNKTVSGDVNAVIRQLIDGEFSGAIVGASEQAGVSVTNYRFTGYQTIRDGLETMLKTVNRKLVIRYSSIDQCCVVGSEPIVDYSNEIEISQDSRLDFEISDNRRGINHLIVVGSDENDNPLYLHLYANANGNIVTSQYYTGNDEITEIYQTGSSTIEGMNETGRDHFYLVKNSKTMTATTAESTDINVDIGDVIAGRDRITNTTISRTVTGKILTIKSGVSSVQYEVEE